MHKKVSVVVPVYNPGDAIGKCIESLLAQTMRAKDLQLIFVDDASTDETPQRLDALAERHKHITVIHRESGSGWSGTPRNDGIRAATGEYIQFLDQDDALAHFALERLYDFATRHGSDLVISKVASDFRPVPNLIYDRTVPACTLAEVPYLVESLTPHKMFRREFLAEHDLVFPDGKRRLEDQPFVVKCYLRAKRISVYGDEVCYFYQRRADGKHTARQTIDPTAYFTFLREVLETVHAETDPGELRSRIMWRWYRTELLRWLTAPNIFRLKPAFVDATWDQVRDIFATYYADGEADDYPLLFGVHGQLVRAGKRHDVEEFARRMGQLRGFAEVVEPTWADTGLTMRVTSSVGASGTPTRVRQVGERFSLPASLTAGIRTIDRTASRSAAQMREHAKGEVVARHRGTGAEWLVGTLETILRPAAKGARDEQELLFDGQITIDPLRIQHGRPMAKGRWDVYVRSTYLGLSRKSRIALSAHQSATFRPLVLGPDALRVTPYITVDGTLAFAVGVNPPAKPHPQVEVDAAASHARCRDGRLHLQLRMPKFAAKADSTPTLRLSSGASHVDASARVDQAGCLRADTELPAVAGKTWKVFVKNEGDVAWTQAIATLLLPANGPVALVATLPAPAPPKQPVSPTRLRRWATKADPVLARLPAPLEYAVRRRLRRLARRMRIRVT